MTTSETAQGAMMDSVHRPVPALVPKLFWFLVAVAVGATLLLAASPSPAQETESTPETAPATPTITLSVNQASVTESSGNITISVTATTSEAVSSPTTVMVEIGRNDDSATRRTDYAYVVPFHITIASGGMTGTSSFNLVSTDDNVAGEGPETITVSGTATGFTVNSTSITLADADTAVTLSVDTSRATESSGDIPVTVKATVAVALSSNLSITVNVGSSGDTATSGTDYKEISDVVITLLEGQTEISTRLNLADTDDNIAGEGSEFLTIRGSNSDSDFIFRNTSFTLVDADSLPSGIILTADTNSRIPGLQQNIEEGNGAVTVTVKASFPTNYSTVLAYDVIVRITGGSSSDSASPGADYRLPAGYVTIKAGSTSSVDTTFTLTVIDDNYAGEGDENLTLSGSHATFTVTKTTLTIKDNDEKPTTINLSVSGNGVEGETKKITVTGSFPAGSAVLVSDTIVTLMFVGDEALLGTDFESISSQDQYLTIARGKSKGSTEVDLVAKEDSVVEGAEDLKVNGSATGFSTINGGEITILDNDITIIIDTDANVIGNQNEVHEEGGTATVIVTAKFPGSSTQNINTIVSIDIGKMDDSATKGTNDDYTVTSPVLITNHKVTIPAGHSKGSTNFVLNINNDSVHEKYEKISFVGSVSGFAIEVQSLMIRDNDILLRVSPNSVSENQGRKALQVEAILPYGNAPAGGIDIIVSVGKRGDSAISGVNYIATDRFTVTIPHEVDKGVTEEDIILLSDTSSEDSVITFDASFRDSDTINSNKYSIQDGSLTIHSVSARSSHFYVYTYRNRLATDHRIVVTEGSSDLRAVVSGISNTRWGWNLITFGGTATSSSDYTIPRRAYILFSRVRSVSSSSDFPLTIIDDNIAEGPEVITLTNVNTSFHGRSITILDNDVAPATINLTVDTDGDTAGKQNTVAESISSKEVTVTAAFPINSARLPRDVEVKLDITGNGGSGEAEDADFDAVTVMVTIRAGDASGSVTFNLSGTDDKVAGEGTETIAVSGSATGFTVNGSTINLVDTDILPTEINLSVDADKDTTGIQSSVTEGTAASTAKVTASFKDGYSIASSTTTVQVSVTGDGGTGQGEAADFTAVDTFNLEIPAGDDSGSATFTLASVQDDYAEGAEKITVSGTASGFTVKSGSVTIDDDDAFPTFALSVDADGSVLGTQTRLGEGSTAKTAVVTASLPNGSKTFESDTVITVSVMGNGGVGEAEAVDFTSVGDFNVTVLAGSRSGSATFTFDPTEDNYAEGAEDVTVSGTTTRVGVSVTSAKVEITDNDTAPSASTLSVDLDEDTTGDQDTIGEGDAAVTVTVTASLPTGSKTFESTTSITVMLEGEGTTGKAESTDFSTNKALDSFEITIPAGGTKGSGTFILTIADDNVVDVVSETITVSGSADRPGLSVTGDTITINSDNDGTGPSTIALSVDTSAVNEGTTTKVKVTASFPSNSKVWETETPVSVTVVGEGTNGKAEPSDFTTNKIDSNMQHEFDVIIPAGSKSVDAEFELTAYDDNIGGETNDSITISGEAKRSDNDSYTVSGTTINITDADSAPTTISLSVDTDGDTTGDQNTISEDSDKISIKITASFGEVGIEGESTVMVTITGGTAIMKSTDDSTVQSEYDFELDSSSLSITISAGASSGSTSFDLVVNNDRQLETVTSGSGETILLSGTRPPNTRFSVTGATIEIIDNEVADLLPGRCNGTYVTNTTLSDLIKDCKILVALRNAWSPNLSDSHPLRTWGDEDNTAITSWSGITVTNNRVSALSLPGVSSKGLIEGSLVSNFGQMKGLTSIDISNNRLNQSIPDSVGALRDLVTLNLSDNDLSGTIPSRLGALKKIVTLDLSNNSLTGNIPDRLGALKKLTKLDISDNHLSGEIPSRLRTLVKSTPGQGLQKFLFCGNNLEGALDVKFQRIETDIRESDYGNIRACRSSIDLSVDTNGDATGSPIHVGEGGGTVTVTVIATWHTYDNTSLTENVVVTITVAGDSATSPGDFTVDKTNFNLTMEKDQTNKTATFRIILVDDNSVEGTEKVSISGEADGYAVNDTELEVTDND